MVVSGRVENGVVVFDGGVAFPEGTRVVVSQLSPVERKSQSVKKAVELPLVSSGEPGSIHLSNEQIHEILNAEDLEAVKRTWDLPS